MTYGHAGEPRRADEPLVPRHLAELERAHAALTQVGRELESAPASRADLRPVARRLETALVAGLDAYDQRRDPLEATREAQLEVAAMREALASLREHDPALASLASPLELAAAALSAAEDRFAKVPMAPPVPRELRASVGVPGVHLVPRPTLRPVIDVAEPLPAPEAEPPPLPPPATFEELEARFASLREAAGERRAAREAVLAERKEEREARAARRADPASPPEGYATTIPAALTPVAFVCQRARDCFEEVAMLGMQRAPLLGDPWRSAAVLETRMLAALDAIAALGPVAVAHLEPLVRDAPAKDPARVFAMAMIAGCLEGRDALAALERVFRMVGAGDPEVRRAVTGALSLAPHPALGPMLRQWLVDTEAPVRAAAIEALAYRGDATGEELTVAARDPASMVRVAALPHAGAMRVPELGDLLAEAARAEDDLVLQEATWTAMALSGDLRAADWPARYLGGEHEERAALAVAIAGERRHAEQLLARLVETGSRPLAVAVGWTGLVSAVPVLMDLLTKGDQELALSAAFALMRITGAELFEDLDLAPEKLDVPDIEEPDVGEPPAPSPLARRVSDPRDLPSDGSPDRMTLPSVRFDRWSRYWREASSKFDPKLRYRRGRLYGPRVSLLELDDYLLTPPERRWLQRELVVRSGRYVRFDPHDFVPVQEQALRAWEAALGSSHQAGTWARASRH